MPPDGKPRREHGAWGGLSVAGTDVSGAYAAPGAWEGPVAAQPCKVPQCPDTAHPDGPCGPSQVEIDQPCLGTMPTPPPHARVRESSPQALMRPIKPWVWVTVLTF